MISSIPKIQKGKFLAHTIENIASAAPVGEILPEVSNGIADHDHIILPSAGGDFILLLLKPIQPPPFAARSGNVHAGGRNAGPRQSASFHFRFRSAAPTDAPPVREPRYFAVDGFPSGITYKRPEKDDGIRQTLADAVDDRPHGADNLDRRNAVIGRKSDLHGFRPGFFEESAENMPQRVFRRHVHDFRATITRQRYRIHSVRRTDGRERTAKPDRTYRTLFVRGEVEDEHQMIRKRTHLSGFISERVRLDMRRVVGQTVKVPRHRILLLCKRMEFSVRPHERSAVQTWARISAGRRFLCVAPSPRKQFDARSRHRIAVEIAAADNRRIVFGGSGAKRIREFPCVFTPLRNGTAVLFAEPDGINREMPSAAFVAKHRPDRAVQRTGFRRETERSFLDAPVIAAAVGETDPAAGAGKLERIGQSAGYRRFPVLRRHLLKRDEISARRGEIRTDAHIAPSERPPLFFSPHVQRNHPP